MHQRKRALQASRPPRNGGMSNDGKKLTKAGLPFTKRPRPR